MANDKRFIVKNGLSGPTVRFSNNSNTTAVLDFNYGTDGTLKIVGNTTLGTLITINDSAVTGTSGVLTVNGDIFFGTSNISVNSTFYEATANNSIYHNGKLESQLSANSAVFANAAIYLNGKQESQLSVLSAVSANSATYLSGYTWATPAAIGATVANTGTFTTLTANTLVINNQLNVPAGVVEMAINYGGPASTNTTFYAGNNSGTVYAKIGSFGLNVSVGSISGSGAGLTGTGTLFTANNSTYSNNASYLNGKQESQLYVANAVFATTAGSVLAGGISGTVANANNSTYLGGFLPSYFTNATNITTGTLPEAQLPFRMNQNVRTTDNVTFANGTFSGTVSIGGDLILTGNLYSQNVQSLSVADPLIKLGANNFADTLWSGFVTHFSTNNHTGLVRNPTTKEYILMSTYGDEASVNNNIIVPTDPSFGYANLAVNYIRIGNSTISGSISANTYTGTSNNATYAYGKQESQLSVANAVFAQTSNNSLSAYGKQESQLSVANAVFAQTANNALSAYGKLESQLSVATANSATFANAASYLNGKAESQLTVSGANNATYLGSYTWATPAVIGGTTANSATFTTLTTSGITTHNANLVMNAAIIANNSAGTAGQILASNGSSVYWISSNNITGTVSTANNATYLNTKSESQLSVANAVFAQTANNALSAYGKLESQLSVANAVFAQTSANTLALQGATWQAPLAIGSVTPSTANFTIANTTNYISIKNIAHLSADSSTTAAITQVQISSFSANTYGSAKIYVQATEAATNVRHVTELLVVHNNLTASATEYGMLYTGTTALATYEVDIASNNVRVLATPASANTISFRVSEQLFLQ